MRFAFLSTTAPVTAGDGAGGLTGGGTLFAQAISLITNFAIAGGGIWLIWGVIVLAGGLKDKNGPALQSGIWQIIGGGMIITAAALFSQIIITT